MIAQGRPTIYLCAGYPAYKDSPTFVCKTLISGHKSGNNLKKRCDSCQLQFHRISSNKAYYQAKNSRNK